MRTYSDTQQATLKGKFKYSQNETDTFMHKANHDQGRSIIKPQFPFMMMIILNMIVMMSIDMIMMMMMRTVMGLRVAN